MVKHIIIWQLKDEFVTEEQKAEAAQAVKNGLESLAGKIPGLLKIQVHTNPLPTSNRPFMLEADFDSFESLDAYRTHPEHVAIADGIVRPRTTNRSCFDYEL